ncbi:MAG: polysaccharide lyase family protein [Planctomycetaceae bacterium]|nr:polysaccharide lyase family protein [Planctomycetaceae bacterium]
MRKSVFKVILLSFLFLSPACAAELWSIGKPDGSCAEFALCGDWNKAARKRPSGTIKKLDGLNTKTDWPWIQAGPVDVWGGSCQYLLGLEFDLPNLDTMKKEGIVALELQLTAAGHNNNPPLLEVDLNGTKREIQILPCGMGAQILANPTSADWVTHKVLFPIDVAKKTGNLLTITTMKGDWMVYDAIQMFGRSENIETLNIQSQKGWLRNPEKNPEAIKSFTIDFGGNILTKPAELTVEIIAEGKGAKTRKKLDPQTDTQKTSITLPMDVTDKPMQATMELKIGDKQITSVTEIPAERKWELHIIHQTHLDIGYTHKQEDVLALQVQSLKDSLKYIEETKDYPDEAKFKFHPEGMWAVEEFMKTATEEEKAAFIQAARNRDIHLDALYAQAMTGMYSDEELFELMGAAVRFGREHGVTIDSAMQTDVPGYTWGLIPVLAKNGVKYMTMAPNPGHRVGRVFEWGDKPFYWESPSGKEKVLCWVISTSYNMFHFKPMGYEIPDERFFGILADFEAKDFPYSIAQFRYCIEMDNGRPNRVISDQVKAWNEKYVYPKLILSRNSDVMRALEERYGDQLPTLRGDYTPYWEDGAASTSEATAINRGVKMALPAYETFLATKYPQKYREVLGAFDSIWADIIMYDEHTWGAHNSIAEPDSDFVIHQDNFKQEYAKRAERTVLTTRELLFKESDEKFFQDYRSEVKLKDFGKVYTDTEKGMIGNGVLAVQVDKMTGAIISLKRKGIDVDLAKPGDDGNAGLNDYLCIIGRNVSENRFRIEGEIKIFAQHFQVQDNQETARLIVESVAPNCNSLRRFISISSYDDSILITNFMEKEMERRPEGVFFGFPFNVPGGKWRVDTPWAMVEVEKDQLPGANRNFYCVQRLCNISNNKFGIDLEIPDAPMVQFAPIKYTPAWDITTWRDHIEPGGTIYSWVCNNHWETNYKAGQDGKLRFQYVIRPHIGPYDASKSQRLVRDDVLKTTHMLQNQIVKLDNESVLITRLKPTRTESGLILRLYNPTDQPQTVTLDFVQKVEQVYLSNPLEDRLAKIPNSILIDPFDFVTLRAE